MYAQPLSGYCAKLRIVLEAKGVDYVEKAPPGGYRSDAYRALVPAATIPALMIGNMALSESEAIAEYLDECFPNPPMLPGDPALRARVRMLSRFHDLSLEPQVRGLFAQVSPQRRDTAMVRTRLAEITKLLGRLEQLIDPQPFVVSPMLSLADCGYAVTLPLARMLLLGMGEDLPLSPRIEAWLRAVHDHPAVIRALAPWHTATKAWIELQSQPASGVRSPLHDASWQYIEPLTLDTFTTADWLLLDRQRKDYYASEQARQVLRLLASSRDDTSFGYQINNYRHSLQSATLALRDGFDEEDIVVALLHDVGFVTCPDTHGEFAAALMAPYVSERNHWMLCRHATFQAIHCPTLPGCQPNAREQWRGHPYFEWAARFVDRYDQAAIDPNFDNAPLDVFEPMVQRIFARPPRSPESRPR